MLALAVLFIAINSPTANPEEQNIKGISLVAPPHEIGPDDLLPIKQINSEWVCILPYAFGKKEQMKIIYNHPRQWWGETEHGVVATIKYAHDHGLKVLLKPHLWMSDGSYTGHFKLSLDVNWRIWENHYRDFVLAYAHIADSMNAEMFCIGNELKIFVAKRPEFWSGLIDTIRTFYDGKLVYAANWDDYTTVTFWGKLDYIGINAYFPLTGSETPQVDELILHWKGIKKDIHKCFKKNWRPVIFTEFGYRSIDFAAKNPWESYGHSEVNLEGQKNAYIALLSTFWSEPWFRGVFAWNWYAHKSNPGGEKDIDFTPQNKPAETVLKEWFSK